MNTFQLNIIIRAVQILMKKGLTLEQALDTYPKLTTDERNQVIMAVSS